jgi:SAM-dependent methyltransferase
MPRTGPFDQYSDRYEDWFVTHRPVFLSELNALKKVIPGEGEGIEIGVGSGIFAAPLGIRTGVEPSEAMRKRASGRNIHVLAGVAENLPCADRSFDFALMVTTICFVDNAYKALREMHRILKDPGVLVLGFVDRNSPVGQKYLEHREESVFYRDAIFYGTDELIRSLAETGFGIGEIYQTVFGELDGISTVQEPLKGYGKGSFVVIEAEKR